MKLEHPMKLISALHWVALEPFIDWNSVYKKIDFSGTRRESSEDLMKFELDTPLNWSAKKKKKKFKIEY